MALAAEQARGGVEADPAGAGHVDLGPGVQVGEVVFWVPAARRRVDVGLELDQVAGDEPRREAQPAQHLDQQPGAVAARAGAQRPGSRPGSAPRLHAHDVATSPLDLGVELDQEVDRAPPIRREPGDRGLEPRALSSTSDRPRDRAQIVGVGERQRLGVGLDEEVERIDHRHLGGEIDRDARTRRVRSGNTSRASQLPCGSCCQLMK
jgi:hypothetical protein